LNRLVLTCQEPCWVVLGGARGRFLATVKAGVRPHNRRKYDPEEQVWLVHWHWLPQVVGWARLHYDHVDYSALPTEWQLRAAGASLRDGPLELATGTQSPYAALYVTEDAPDEVVQAAYRALAKKHHPDVGGDADSFRRIREAFEEISSTRKPVDKPVDSCG